MNRIDIQKVERSVLSAHATFRQYRIEWEVTGPATRDYIHGKILITRWMNRRESFGFLLASLLPVQSKIDMENLEAEVSEMLDKADRDWVEAQREWKEMRNERSE